MNYVNTRIMEICSDVDALISIDPGAADLETLESARLKMNDYLMAEKFRAAEDIAYLILLCHSGQDFDNQLLDALKN